MNATKLAKSAAGFARRTGEITEEETFISGLPVFFSQGVCRIYARNLSVAFVWVRAF
jgi:hypothetical protein